MAQHEIRCLASENAQLKGELGECKDKLTEKSRQKRKLYEMYTGLKQRAESEGVLYSPSPAFDTENSSNAKPPAGTSASPRRSIAVALRASPLAAQSPRLLPPHSAARRRDSQWLPARAAISRTLTHASRVLGAASRLCAPTPRLGAVAAQQGAAPAIAVAASGRQHLWLASAANARHDEKMNFQKCKKNQIRQHKVHMCLCNDQAIQ